jgi:hypothetical protein
VAAQALLSSTQARQDSNPLPLSDLVRLQVGYLKATGNQTIYTCVACGTDSVVLTPSLVKKLR